jgi:tRNA nucleotidyltransferase domain 2 putative
MLLLETNALEVVGPLLNHTSVTALKKLDRCAGELETKLALLYSGKSVKLVEEELLGLKMSTKEVKRVLFLLTTLERFSPFKESSTLPAYRRFMARIKNEAPDTWEHTYQQFIELARALELPFEKLSFYEDEIVLARKELAINGNDLLGIGVSPGPKFKELLDITYQVILEHPEKNDKEYLLSLVTEGLIAQL